MSINVSELIWTILCFLVLLFVLKKLLFDPLIRFMDERKAKVDEGIAAGKEAEAAREANDRELQEKRKAKAAEAAQLLAEARAKDEKARAEALAEAHKQNADAMKDAKAQLLKEEAAAEETLEAQMPELVETLTSALLAGKR